jgi:hypothetical protein
MHLQGLALHWFIMTLTWTQTLMDIGIENKTSNTIKLFIPSRVIFVHLCFLLSTSSSVCCLLLLPSLGFILYNVNKKPVKLQWVFGEWGVK